MGFGSLPSGLVDFMASQPNTGGPRVIEPEPDEPTTRPRRAMQLDASNLAGPVPTQLNGGSAPFDYSQILSRGVTDTGQPQMDTSPNRADTIESPTQGRFTVDGMGVPRETPPAAIRPMGLNNPAIPQTPYDRLNNGTPMPTMQDQKYQDMGRGASAKAAFLQGLSHGGLIGGGLNALIGVLDKGYGRQAQYNQDAQRWFNTKDAQLQVEQRDPLLQHRLAVGQFEEELPGRIQQQQAYQQAIGNRTVNVENVKHDNKMEEIDSKDADSYARAGLHEDAKTNRRYNERYNLLRNSSANAGKSDTEMRNDAAATIKAEDDVKLANDKLRGSRITEAIAASKEHIKTANANLALSRQRLDLAKQSLQQRKDQSTQTMAQRADFKDRDERWKALNETVTELKGRHTGLTRIVSDPFANKDSDLYKNAEKELYEVNGQLKKAGEDAKALAPAKGQSAAPPANPAGHKVGDIVKAPDGKRIKITGIKPNGDVDYDEVP